MSHKSLSASDPLLACVETVLCAHIQDHMIPHISTLWQDKYVNLGVDCSVDVSEENVSHT